MNNIKKTLAYILIIEVMLVSIVMTIAIHRLWNRYDELLEKTSVLEERINNMIISNRLFYQDIIQLQEYYNGEL